MGRNEGEHCTAKDALLYLLPTINSLALAPQGVLVEQVLGHLVVLGVHLGEVGDVVS